MDVSKLAQEIIDGRRLGRGDALKALVTAELEPLCCGADRIRETFVGDRVDLCTIVNGKSGRCSEDCRFCAQSGHHHTGCESYPLLSEETFIAAARENEQEGVSRFSVVCSGRGPSEKDFSQMLRVFERLHQELRIGLCCSLGFLSTEQLRQLRRAGVSRIHNNIETSRRFFPEICTTHGFSDKLENIRRAQQEGFFVCSGGIIGMGESWEDRLDMALTLHELGILSIPLNSLMPVPGTAFGGQARLREEEILRTVAIFRYLNPEAQIRLAGGRALMRDHGREAFRSGASAGITGNMLTTSGSTIRSDRELLHELGRDTTPDWARPAGETAF